MSIIQLAIASVLSIPSSVHLDPMTLPPIEFVHTRLALSSVQPLRHVGSCDYETIIVLLF